MSKKGRKKRKPRKRGEVKKAELLDEEEDKEEKKKIGRKKVELEEEEETMVPEDEEEGPEEESEEKEEDDEEEEDPEITDDGDDPGETGEENKIEEAESWGDDEVVWEAVEWDEVGPTESNAVFQEGTVMELLQEAVDQAWEDGVVTDDEMALLNVLKRKLDIDDETFNGIIEGSRPEVSQVGPGEDTDSEEEEVHEEDIVLEEEPEEEIEEEDLSPEKETEEVEDEEKFEFETEDEYLGKDPEEEPETEMDTHFDTPEEGSTIPEDSTEPGTPQTQGPQFSGEGLQEHGSPIPSQEQEKDSGIITFTSSIRRRGKPLGQSFDLSNKKEEKSFKRRCPHCRALIRVNPGEGKNNCPICGGKVVQGRKESPGLRKILDQAKSAYKEGDRSTARELYAIALAQSPNNKEAMFYLQKLQHGKRPTRRSNRVDARNIQFIKTRVNRLDMLMGGGFEVGSQVLLKGPAFCGKEVLLEKVMSSTLYTGLPVIYVSTNRAMKEVLHGIIRQVPDFKRFNQDGMIRMYDLFSKYSAGKVLKEGHRIFNIEEREDFKRFQGDIVFMLEDLVREYHGGVLIINSLSPLVTKADQADLMKFLQVLIARSKSYRFTNVLDIASGIHSDSVVNSVEYLMDGIVEFKEQDSKNSLRLKGFKQNVASRDWVEYRIGDNELELVGSFNEERIM